MFLLSYLFLLIDYVVICVSIFRLNTGDGNCVIDWSTRKTTRWHKSFKHERISFSIDGDEQRSSKSVIVDWILFSSSRDVEGITEGFFDDGIGRGRLDGDEVPFTTAAIVSEIAKKWIFNSRNETKKEKFTIMFSFFIIWIC